MVAQSYAVNLMEEYVLRGNSAILKCHIPSFVSEYVSVISWIISEGAEELEIKLDSTQNNLDGTKIYKSSLCFIYRYYVNHLQSRNSL